MERENKFVRELKAHMKTDVPVIYLDTCASTNTYVKELAKAGANHGTVVVAGSQTAGRGRMGRSFFSPDNSGLYMSILLRPLLSAAASLEITTAAAVAMTRVIKEHSCGDVGIKWVNDIYVNMKKVCGILTEAAVKPDGMLDFAVLGIGVNLFMPEGGFPDDIRDIAASVFDTASDEIVKARFCARVTDEFFSLYPLIGKNMIVDEYRENSLVIGKKINVIKADGAYPAEALDVTRDYSLSVKYEDGTSDTINSGDVSIRLK